LNHGLQAVEKDKPCGYTRELFQAERGERRRCVAMARRPWSWRGSGQGRVESEVKQVAGRDCGAQGLRAVPRTLAVREMKAAGFKRTYHEACTSASHRARFSGPEKGKLPRALSLGFKGMLFPRATGLPP
jgi:hypothetical protein